jgi:biopolymer transport protein ExbD
VFRRPTARRRTAQQPIILNLVPILDAMVTLIAFMLFTMSFIALTGIESPFPQSAPPPPTEKVEDRPLQLTVTVREMETEIWSPFDRIPAQKIPNPKPHQPDVRAIHEALVGVKQKFPAEKTLVIAPTGAVSYDSLIGLMDSARGLEPSDPPIFVKNPETGIDESLKVLFPNVIFGNLLGEG